RKIPSRCIFFFSAFRAWSTLLSRTRTCTLAPSLLVRQVKVKPQEREASGRAPLAEKALRVHSSNPEREAQHLRCIITDQHCGSGPAHKHRGPQDHGGLHSAGPNPRDMSLALCRELRPNAT